MRSKPTGSSEYRPIVRAPLLPDIFGDACDRCGVTGLCGEAAGATACHSARELAQGYAHPDDPDFRPADLALPTRGFEWQALPEFGRTLSEATPFAPLGTSHLAPLATALTSRSLPPLSDIGASLIGRDERLQKLWGQHGSLGATLRLRGYSYAIAPALSTWADATPLAGLYAVARTAAIASTLSRQIPTVPTLAWRNARDIERQVQWLEIDRQESPVIAVDVGARLSDQFEWIIQGVLIIASQLHHPDRCRLIAHGTANPSRIERLAQAWLGPLTIASSHPAHVARRGWLLDGDLVAAPAPDLTLVQCAAASIGAFDLAVNLIVHRARLSQAAA